MNNCADDKGKEGCGRDFAISTTGCQYVFMIVAEAQAPSAPDHDFNTEHSILSATHHMNITSDACDSLYISDQEGRGRVYVSFHDATFDSSTVIKHAVNVLCVMRNRIGSNESLCPFHLVGLETDVRGNHNHKQVRNQIAIFGLFLLGNTDKINMTYGCPSLPFIHTAERAMAF